MGAEVAQYFDVLIVGAGFSGIGAAYRIQERNPSAFPGVAPLVAFGRAVQTSQAADGPRALAAPPIEPLPELPPATLTIVPVPGNAPEDVVVDGAGYCADSAACSRA